MEVSPDAAVRFLEKLWYSWGVAIIDRFGEEFDLDEARKAELVRLYLRPNDWQVVAAQEK